MTPAQIAHLRTIGFKPGQSGNPGGRSREEAAVKRLFREDVHRARALVLKIMDDEEADRRVRLDAAKVVLAYGLGAPPKEPLIDDEAAANAVPTPEEAAAAAARLRAARDAH